MITVENIAKEIKDNNIDIIAVLEQLGYYQHILSGRDFVEERINALCDCLEIDITDDDKDGVKKIIADIVMEKAGHGKLDNMNDKTDDMMDSDDDAVDLLIEDVVREMDGVELPNGHIYMNSSRTR